ncbi:MAG: hypothetical protein IT173_10435 [Acidobacteria bacterium]|nr:hypothetical protein [Acidobacteriota bacterium]
MKYTYPLTGIALAVLLTAAACSSTSAPNTANSSHAANTAATPTPVAASTTPVVDASLDLLKRSVGKTAAEIGLWENDAITARLEKLLGADYPAMKQTWQTQTPIEAEGSVLSLTGCENNNCGDNQYLMYIDTVNNNINVYRFKDGKMKTYTEKGEIKLPQGLAKDLETTMQNAETSK